MEDLNEHRLEVVSELLAKILVALDIINSEDTRGPQLVLAAEEFLKWKKENKNENKLYQENRTY